MSKTKSRPSGGKTAPVKDLIKHIVHSELPGDERLPKERQIEIAEFLIEAAENRPEKTAAITIASVPEGRRGTRIALINDDMPFLVDSIASTLAEFDLVADTLIHPVIPVDRDKEGNLKALRKDGSSSHEESFIYVEAPRVDGAHRHQIEEALRTTLGELSHQPAR